MALSARLVIHDVNDIDDISVASDNCQSGALSSILDNGTWIIVTSRQNEGPIHLDYAHASAAS